MRTVSKLSVELCRANPKTLFVFGDNLVRLGKAGQAIIRDEPNAFGIPTKRLPSKIAQAYFSDQSDERTAVFQAMDQLEKLMMYDGYSVVFPTAGLGTGLALMELKSPCLFREMNEELKLRFK